MKVLPQPGGPVEEEAAAQALAVQLAQFGVAHRREEGSFEAVLDLLHAADVREPYGPGPVTSQASASPGSPLPSAASGGSTKRGSTMPSTSCSAARQSNPPTGRAGSWEAADPAGTPGSAVGADAEDRSGSAVPADSAGTPGSAVQADSVGAAGAVDLGGPESRAGDTEDTGAAGFPIARIINSRAAASPGACCSTAAASVTAAS